MELEKEIKQKKFKNQYEKLTVNLMFTNSWLNSIQNKLFKPYGLSPQQYNVLRILRGQNPEPASVNLIMDRMLDKTSNASRLVEKLRQKGLIDRKPCKNDRRQVDIFITDNGLELLAEIDVNFSGFEKNFHTLTETEAQTINDLLDKLRG